MGHAFRSGPLASFEELEAAMKPSVSEVQTLVAREMHPTTETMTDMQATGSNTSNVAEILQDDTHEVPTLVKRELQPIMELGTKVQAEGPSAGSATEIEIRFQDNKHEARMLAVGDWVRLNTKGRNVQADYDWSGDALQPWELGEVTEVGRTLKIRGPRGEVDEYEVDDLQKGEPSTAQNVASAYGAALTW